MKTILLGIFLFTFAVGSKTEPTLIELQSLVEKMKKGYDIIEDDFSNSEFNLQKDYSDKELQKKVEQMKEMLESNPTLKKYYNQ